MRFLPILLAPAMVLVAFAQDAAKSEAEALVKQAIGYAMEHGKDEAFKVITVPGGPFHKHGGELYVFVLDLDGKVLAHGQGVSRVGANYLNAKDADGKEFIKEQIALAKSKGHGWVSYKWQNTTTHKIEPKTTYIEMWSNLVFGAGVYVK